MKPPNGFAALLNNNYFTDIIYELMNNWKNICRAVRNADKSSEMSFQRAFCEMVLEGCLGWKPQQIIQQLSLRLGSTERLIPDVVVKQNDDTSFVIEVKHPSHVKSQRDVEQLTSYMKQLETSIGLYVADTIDVYYKKIGDSSSYPIQILSLALDDENENGATFVELFSAETFSLDNVLVYKQRSDAVEAFNSAVLNVISKVTSQDFEAELRNVLLDYFGNNGFDKTVVTEALDRIKINITEQRSAVNPSNSGEQTDTKVSAMRPYYQPKRNRGIAQRFAYHLIYEIIRKNPAMNFRQLQFLFKYKNYIEDIQDISAPERWCMSESDIITLNDGTKIAVSNQWGFHNKCKTKMDRLREIANRFGIDSTLPQGV